MIYDDELEPECQKCQYIQDSAECWGNDDCPFNEEPAPTLCEICPAAKQGYDCMKKPCIYD